MQFKTEAGIILIISMKPPLRRKGTIKSPNKEDGLHFEFKYSRGLNRGN